jgi:hypothetical protein
MPDVSSLAPVDVRKFHRAGCAQGSLDRGRDTAANWRCRSSVRSTPIWSRSPPASCGARGRPTPGSKAQHQKLVDPG